MRFFDIGYISFADALALQEWLAAEIAAGETAETVLLLEHPEIYTSGRGGAADNVKDAAINVIYTNRGGDVTWHGPGQLVAYPLLDLTRRGNDLHRLLRFHEEVVIALLADYGVRSYRVKERTGVWTDAGKIASIGIGVRRWVTMHGTALNVSCATDAFDRINPCGIARCPVTTLEREVGASVPFSEVKARYRQNFRSLLQDWSPGTRPLS